VRACLHICVGVYVVVRADCVCAFFLNSINALTKVNFVNLFFLIAEHATEHINVYFR